MKCTAVQEAMQTAREQDKHEAELAQKKCEQASKELLEKEKLEAEQAKLKSEEGKKIEEGQQQNLALEKVGGASAGTTTPPNK